MGRLLIILLWGALFYFLWNLFSPSKRGGQTNKDEGIQPMVLDPNCNTYISKAGAVRKKIGGQEHYFCSKKCLMEYQGKKK